MGQSASTSGDVSSYNLRRHREYFVQFNDTFVPLVTPAYVYDFNVRVKRPSQLEVFTLQDKLVHRQSLSVSAGGSCVLVVASITVSSAAFYKVKIFDLSVVVFFEDSSVKQITPPEFSNALPNWLPDSIDFRNIVASMETDLQHFQKSSVWKNLLDSLTKINDTLIQLSQLLGSVTKISFPSLSHRNILIELLSAGLFDRIRSFKTNQVDVFSKNLSHSVINPLHEFNAFNSQNQKTVSKIQKNFNELTKSFYVNPSQTHSPLHSKRDFELARLDYYDLLYQSLYNGLPLRKFASSICLFLYNKRISESEFNLSYMPRVNALRASIKRSKDFQELATLHQGFKISSNFKEDIVLIRYLKQNGNSIDTLNSNESTTTSSSTSGHWHRQWIVLNDYILQLYSTSKKLQNNTSSRFHQINLSFACIKQINAKTLDVITTGSPLTISVPTHLQTQIPAAATNGTAPLSSTAYSTSTTTAVGTTPNDDLVSPVRFLLQFHNENEMKTWLSALRQQATQEIHSSSKSMLTNESTHSLKNESNSLLSIVKNQHESNSTCCDCGSTESVEWISINILCVVCIKCSGVHRSMGSHISKMRSLTLDNFASPEILQLIQHNVSNSNVNSIYESSSTKRERISSTSTDAERSQYIIEKYQLKTFVDDGKQARKKSFKALIKAIHLNSIYLLQKCIAQSSDSLKEIIEAEKGTTNSDQPQASIFQYSLKHHEMVNAHPIFFITEFLLINGVPIDKLPRDTQNWAPDVLDYWKSRIEIYGTYKPVTLNCQKEENISIKPSNSKSQLPALTIPSDKSNKRWSLNPISASAQLKSPTNLLAMHKSLKLPKRGANTHKE